jgi:Flp pilus assembly protein TadG
MLSRCHRNRHRLRRGGSLVELVLVTPFLVGLCFAAFDFGRVYYASLTIANCARNGAMYASDASYQAGLTDLQSAALADDSSMTPTPTVTQTTGTASDGATYAAVTVSYPFRMACSYLNIANPLTISRTVSMRQAAQHPDTQ